MCILHGLDTANPVVFWISLVPSGHTPHTAAVWCNYFYLLGTRGVAVLKDWHIHDFLREEILRFKHLDLAEPDTDTLDTPLSVPA